MFSAAARAAASAAVCASALRSAARPTWESITPPTTRATTRTRRTGRTWPFSLVIRRGRTLVPPSSTSPRVSAAAADDPVDLVRDGVLDAISDRRGRQDHDQAGHHDDDAEVLGCGLAPLVPPQ